MNRTALSDLGRALRVLGEHGDRLSPADLTPELLHEIADDLERARRLLATAGRPRPTTRCREHPHGPVEPDTDGGCLLCRIRRRPASAVPVASVPEPAAPEVVLRAVNELGEREAVRRFGPRAVAMAAAKAGRSTHKHTRLPARKGPDTTKENPV